jgi:hypothetical protein
MRNKLKNIIYKIGKPYYKFILSKKDPQFIILGNPKTGTSVIASLIATFGNLSKTIDIPEIWYRKLELYENPSELEKIIESYPHRFAKDVVKEPDLTFFGYKKIKDIFPNSKIILIIRHPVDNIRSILDRVKIKPTDMPIHIENISFENIIDPWKWTLKGDVLKDNFAKKIPYTLAYNWVYTANLYLENEEDVFLIRYEDFMKNKLNAIKNYAKDLGINKQNDISHLVDKQFQPKGENKTGDIKELFSKEVIDNVESICFAEMKELGYKFYSKK